MSTADAGTPTVQRIYCDTHAGGRRFRVVAWHDLVVGDAFYSTPRRPYGGTRFAYGPFWIVALAPCLVRNPQGVVLPWPAPGRGQSLRSEYLVVDDGPTAEDFHNSGGAAATG